MKVGERVLISVHGMGDDAEHMKIAATCLVLVAGLIIGSNLSFGKMEYSKKEGGAKCTVCHTAMGKKDLNDVGKCYHEKKDLKACQPK